MVAWDAERGAAYLCPACGDPVALKRGRIVTAHFAHRPGFVCSLAAGESPRHLQMKAQIGALFPGLAVAYEVPLLPERRADVTLGDRIVVECQASPILIEEWEQRTRDYNRIGRAVLWVWNLARIGPVKELDGPCVNCGEGPECRVPAEVRYCHQQSYGRVYALPVSGALRSCHLYPPEERWRYGSGDYPDRLYSPKTIRHPEFRECPLRLTTFKGSDGLGLVQLGEGVWWKK